MLPQQLTTGLLDLLAELEPHQIPITLGGGLGLYLKRLHLDNTRERTLLTELPEPRGTNDMDVFIRAEVLADLSQTIKICEAIKNLGYEPIEQHKYWQWVKRTPSNERSDEIKIDLLVGPFDQYESQLRYDDRRARPKGEVQLHARPTLEALAIDENTTQFQLPGKLSSGREYSAKVHVPQPFSYLMMKACAFNDRKHESSGDANKDQGRHHALDLYTTVALMTEPEFEQTRTTAKRFESHQQFKTVQAIVAEDFSEITRLGNLRIQEHRLYRPEFQLAQFIDVLKELFQVPNKAA